MPSERGFTLIETLIATAILVSGLVAVAYLFTYSVRTNITNDQLTSATLLLYNKMEELEAVSLANLTVGGGLDGASPTANFFDYVTVGATGALTVNTTDTNAPYLRVWQVTGANPKSITVAVHAQRAGFSGDRREMVRATTSVTSSF